MTQPSQCPSCGSSLEPGDQTCQRCGQPLPLEPGAPDAACKVCGAVIGAYTETCPNCGEVGYPALRPRHGKKWQGPPTG